MKNVGIVVNRHLAQLAGLAEATLLERVAHVREIRTSQVQLNLLLKNTQRLRQLEDLHAAVHEERFDASLTGFRLAPTWVPLVLELPAPFYAWLKAYSFGEIEAQLINWLAALYAAHCQRDRMLTALKPDIKWQAQQRYSPSGPGLGHEMAACWAAEYDRERQRLFGTAHPDVLRNPFTGPGQRPNLDNPLVRQSFQFEVRAGYFTESDWLYIVERDRQKLRQQFPALGAREIEAELRQAATDPLRRAESSAGLWQHWRDAFAPPLANS